MERGAIHEKQESVKCRTQSNPRAVRAITAEHGAIHNRQQTLSAEHRAIGGRRRAGSREHGAIRARDGRPSVEHEAIRDRGEGPSEEDGAIRTQRVAASVGRGAIRVQHQGNKASSTEQSWRVADNPSVEHGAICDRGEALKCWKRSYPQPAQAFRVNHGAIRV